MAKVAPLIQSFNAGEFSILLEGRVDLERYRASMRSLFNWIAAPQGPALRRSGTMFTSPMCYHDKPSTLIPFEPNDEQAQVIEFADLKARFYDEDGVQVYDPEPITDVVQTNPLIIDNPTLDAVVGESVALSGFPAATNMNGAFGKITAKVGTQYTLDIGYADDASYTYDDATAAVIYEIDTPYTAAQAANLRFVQQVDTLYLFDATGAKRHRKLQRYGGYDWRLSKVDVTDGPFMPVDDKGIRLTPASTGNVAVTGNGAATTGGETAPNLCANAFDNDLTTFWESNTDQKGTLTWTPTAPFACRGYVIYGARDNSSVSYSAMDYAPGSWTFEGWDGTNWIVLDQQQGHELYDGFRTPFFKLNNTTVYSAYKLNITACKRNGTIKPRVAKLVLADVASELINFTASGTTGINKDQGFLATDVERLIRVKGSDGYWRALEITDHTNATTFQAKLQGEPLPNTNPILEWRLGYWSDTTGWPMCGLFYGDRLWGFGSIEFPDLCVGSVVGAYESISQTTPFGEVDDDSAIVVRLNAKKLARIQWASSDDRGIMLGTQSGEWILRGMDTQAKMTARNIEAKNSTERGSAQVDCVKVDSQTLYVQRSKRTIREFAYVFEADGYKTPSMSQLASHIGAKKFEQMVYAAEPYSVVWSRRADGTLAGLTYNRDENVIGWHRHDVGGFIETMAVIPAQDQATDVLWLGVRRTINGQTRRYIERLTRFWDFDFTLDDAFYVDSGLRYDGPALVDGKLYGLPHLEGMQVVGLADGVAFGPLTVENGMITLPTEAQKVVVGLGIENEGETHAPEAGGDDGTAQGKEKRWNRLSALLWDSVEGEFGVHDDQNGEVKWEPIPYNEAPYDELSAAPEPRTEIVGPIHPDAGYGKRGALYFRQPADKPYPLNIVAFFPQGHTQNR